MTKTEHVGALPRNLSISVSDIKYLVWLMGIGLTIVALNQYVKIPVGIPGHRVEWVALIVIARLSSPYPWSATISGATAASTMAAMHLANPVESFIFLAFGMAFDLLYGLFRRPKNVIVIGIIAALAFLSKPIIMIAADIFTGLPYRPLILNAWWPIATYTVFGFIGGLIGVAIMDIDKRLVKTLRRGKEKSR